MKRHIKTHTQTHSNSDAHTHLDAPSERGTLNNTSRRHKSPSELSATPHQFLKKSSSFLPPRLVFLLHGARASPLLPLSSSPPRPPLLLSCITKTFSRSHAGETGLGYGDVGPGLTAGPHRAPQTGCGCLTVGGEGRRRHCVAPDRR